MGKKRSSIRAIWLGSCGALLLALVPACGGSSTGAGPVTFQELPSQLAATVCDNIGGCCRAGQFAFDSATCKATLTAALNQTLASESSPNIKYDAAAAGDCLNVYGNQIKSCSLDQTVLNAACGRVFVGSVPVGGACNISDECLSPAGSHASCAAGVCTVFGGVDNSPHGKLGEACAGTCETSDSCGGVAPSGGGVQPTAICYNADNLYCADNQTCQPLVALGAACSFDGCVAGTFCSAGVCVAAQPNGAACNQSNECAAGTCTFGQSSSSNPNPTSGTCGLPAVANAQTCAGNFD